MSLAHPGLRLGQIGAWLNPVYGDDARTALAIQAESLGFATAWLGFGRAPVSDLALPERILDATSTITVATAIVNTWANDLADAAASYRRIAARHGGRFLLGTGIGHPESVTAYRQPHATMVNYPGQLDAGGVPPDRRILTGLGPRALHLAADRTLGTHPYLTVFGADVRAADLHDPGRLVTGLISRELLRERLPADAFGNLDPAGVSLAKTADRSVLGCMNDMAFMCETVTTRSGGLAITDIADLNRALRRNINSARATSRRSN